MYPAISWFPSLLPWWAFRCSFRQQLDLKFIRVRCAISGHYCRHRSCWMLCHWFSIIFIYLSLIITTLHFFFFWNFKYIIQTIYQAIYFYKIDFYDLFECFEGIVKKEMEIFWREDYTMLLSMFLMSYLV